MPPPLNAAARFPLVYRPYTAADFDFIEALYFSTRDEELALSNWTDEQKHVFLKQQHHAQHHHYTTYYPNAERLILELDGKSVGRLYVDAWTRELRVVDISLIPAARGNGLGEAILPHPIEWATGMDKGVSIHVEK